MLVFTENRSCRAERSLAIASWLLRVATGLGAALVAGPSTAAPSFACARAANAAERAICAAPALAALDVRIAAGYRAGSALFAALPGWREEQRTFIVERDRCGADRACLGTRMRAPASALAGGPDPSRPGPSDAFAGRYRPVRLGGTLTILRSGPGSAWLSVATSDPESGRWTCEPLAAHLDASGQLLAGRTDEGAITVRRAGHATVALAVAPEVAAAQCGLNGTYDGSFERVTRPPTRNRGTPRS